MLPYPSQAASWRNGNPNGSGKTPTTAPNPPQTTRPNPWGRGRDTCAYAPCSLNALDTQAWWAYQAAGGGGGNRCIAQVWQGNTPRTPTLWPVECEAWEAINRRRVGTPVRRGAEDLIGVATPGAPAGARSFASDRGWRRLDWKGMGGYMRGCSIRACRKDDERMTLYKRGGCILSHSIAWKINKKKPDRTGGIVDDLDYEQTQCDCRPGGGAEIRVWDRHRGSWNLWRGRHPNF